MRKNLFVILGALVFAAFTVACGSADLGITTKVKSILDSDRNVPSAAQIQVTTENKVVTLAGKVDSPSTKQRAVVIASGVEGVKKVVDNLTVAPTSVADAQPAVGPVPVAESQPAVAPAPVADSQPAPVAKAQPSVAKIPVANAQPSVDKIPVADSQPAPVAKAQPSVAKIPVANAQPSVDKIPVAESQSAVAPIPVADAKPAVEAAPGTATAPTDAAITQAVKEKLLLQPETSSKNIGVDTHEGVVTLSGMVKSQQEKEQVMQIARGTEGVQRVEDKLSVSTS
jgi:osmotically-inducible protein OsmY